MSESRVTLFETWGKIYRLLDMVSPIEAGKLPQYAYDPASEFPDLLLARFDVLQNRRTVHGKLGFLITQLSKQTGFQNPIGSKDELSAFFSGYAALENEHVKTWRDWSGVDWTLSDPVIADMMQCKEPSVRYQRKKHKQ